MVEVEVKVKKSNKLRRIGEIGGASIAVLGTGFLLRHDSNIDKMSLAISVPIVSTMGSLIGGGILHDVSLFKDDAIKYLRTKRSELNTLYNKLRR